MLVYVLPLEEGYRYVGSCRRDRLDARLEEHVRGEGAAFTRKHPPLKPIRLKCSTYPYFSSWSEIIKVCYSLAFGTSAICSSGIWYIF
jgi:hypothetical protein